MPKQKSKYETLIYKVMQRGNKDSDIRTALEVLSEENVGIVYYMHLNKVSNALYDFILDNKDSAFYSVLAMVLRHRSEWSTVDLDIIEELANKYIRKGLK